MAIAETTDATGYDEARDNTENMGSRRVLNERSVRMSEHVR
jgi:hypothetical protein